MSNGKARPAADGLSIEHGRFLGTTNVDALAEGLGLPLEGLEAKIEGLFDQLGMVEQARPLLAELAGYCEAALCRLSAAVEADPEPQEPQRHSAGRLVLVHG